MLGTIQGVPEPLGYAHLFAFSKIEFLHIFSMVPYPPYQPLYLRNELGTVHTFFWFRFTLSQRLRQTKSYKALASRLQSDMKIWVHYLDAR